MDRTDHSTQSLTTLLPKRAGELLYRLRQSQPRIHAITNAAAQVFTANLLLASGAIPSLTIAPEEVASFTEKASALLVNLGTLDSERRKAFPIAIEAARAANRPWVLDPVFIDSSPVRLNAARDLLDRDPAILRCNACEFSALAGESLPPSKPSVAAFAKRHSLTVALTGASDIVSDGVQRTVTLSNGHPLMGMTTAMGCAGTALIAAFAALSRDKFEAAAAALLVIGIAGEIAGEAASGPGSFPSCFLDALYRLDADTIINRARIS